MIRCRSCRRRIRVDESAHQAHDADCCRFLDGFCRCEGWLCVACCPDEVCSPLQSVLRDANLTHRAQIEAAEGVA